MFAPTDAAFANVPRRTLTALGQDKAKLRAVLLYHVVGGKDPAKTVVKRCSAKTLKGSTVRIRVRDGTVCVTADAGRHDERPRVQRHHPRDQQGPDPPLGLPRSPARPRRAGPREGYGVSAGDGVSNVISRRLPRAVVEVA